MTFHTETNKSHDMIHRSHEYLNKSSDAIEHSYTHADTFYNVSRKDILAGRIGTQFESYE